MSEWFNQKERCAGALRIKIVWWFCIVFGRRAARFLIFFIVLFAYPFLPEARDSAKKFFGVLNGFEKRKGMKPTKPKVFKLLYNYALSMLDKMLSLSKRIPKNSVSLEASRDAEAFKNLVNSGKGAFLIFSHIGNFEVLGSNGAEAFGTRKPEIFALVENWSDSVFRTEFLSKSKESAFHFFDVSEINIATFEKLNAELERGNLIIAGGTGFRSALPTNFSRKMFWAKNANCRGAFFSLPKCLNAPCFLRTARSETENISPQ